MFVIKRMICTGQGTLETIVALRTFARLPTCLYQTQRRMNVDQELDNDNINLTPQHVVLFRSRCGHY
ncbi:hypothetical protein WJX79_003138 [Trebouxia sp. C0005]